MQTNSFERFVSKLGNVSKEAEGFASTHTPAPIYHFRWVYFKREKEGRLAALHQISAFV